MNKKYVLIVDDHAPVVRVLRLGIESAGYIVDSAENGCECLEKLSANHPDFLITDIDMPRMTGDVLCQEIQRQYPDRMFPIVVLSSRTELEHRNWTREMSNLTFMEKPVSVRRLISHIDICLAEQRHGTGG